MEKYIKHPAPYGFMKQKRKTDVVTISADYYLRLKKKEKFADNAIVRLKLSQDVVNAKNIDEVIV